MRADNCVYILGRNQRHICGNEEHAAPPLAHEVARRHFRRCTDPGILQVGQY